MALDAARGTLTLSTGAIGTTFTVSGLSFQPKVVILNWSSRTATGTAEADAKPGMGIFTSTSNRRAFAYSLDHANTAGGVAGQVWRNDCCMAVQTAAGATEGLVDVDAVNSDGFRLIIDDTLAAAYIVEWLALGGADLTDIAIVDFQAPATTGNQDVTCGFALNTGEDDKAVLIFGGLDDAVNTNGGWARFHLGMAAGNSISQAVLMAISINGVDPSQAFTYCRAAECCAYAEADNAVSVRGNLTTWLGDGFRINWTEATANQPRFTALVLKGGRYEVGSLTTSTGTTNQTEGTARQPKGLILASANKAESASDTTAATFEASVGWALGAADRSAVGVLGKDAAGTSDIATSHLTDAMYINLSTATTIVVEGLMDLVSFDSTPGFTWVMDDADPSGAFVFYLAFANTPGAGDVIARLVGSDLLQSNIRPRAVLA